MTLGKVNCNVKPIETKDYPTPAKRPHFSVLNKSKIKNDFEIDIPILERFLSEMYFEKLKNRIKQKL